MPTEHIYPERLMREKRVLLNKRKALMKEVNLLDEKIREKDRLISKSYEAETERVISILPVGEF